MYFLKNTHTHKPDKTLLYLHHLYKIMTKNPTFISKYWQLAYIGHAILYTIKTSSYCLLGEKMQRLFLHLSSFIVEKHIEWLSHSQTICHNKISYFLKVSNIVNYILSLYLYCSSCNEK
jgi:hypothetical protein